MGVLDDTAYQTRSPEWLLGGTEERNMGGQANSNPGPGEYDCNTDRGISSQGSGVPFGNAARIGGELNSETPGPGSYDVQISEAIHGQGQGFSFGGGARIMDTASATGPGPGAYASASALDNTISGQGQGYTFSSAPRIADTGAGSGPGPGTCAYHEALHRDYSFALLISQMMQNSCLPSRLT